MSMSLKLRIWQKKNPDSGAGARTALCATVSRPAARTPLAANVRENYGSG